MKAPRRFKTDRLILRKPRTADAEAIFAGYAADGEVTRFLAWPKHRSLDATRQFLEFSDAEWACWPAGPYLITLREDGRIIGSTGLAFETPQRASTGYVLAKSLWGCGFATESLRAVIEIARLVGLVRLYALCHTDHAPSWRVLEKCGFSREGILQRYCEFPNLLPDIPCDVFCYALIFR